MAERFDVIVIGMGVGGEEVAGRLAQDGMNVLGVERNLVGGECPYWGCIPSKIMVRAASSLAEAERVEILAGASKTWPEWGRVAERIREATAAWDDRIAVDRFENKGGTFLRGEARIVAPRQVQVDGELFTAARGIVVATGGEPAVPPLEGLSDVEFWTNREAIEAKELPASLVVLGAGPIGLELAQAFRRFGTEITLIEMGDHALPMEEPENGAAMDAVIREQGMSLHTKTSARSVRRSDAGVAVELSNGSIVEGERLLLATGRKLNIGSVGVETLGIDPRSRALETDEYLRAGDGVWAVGDVTGRGAFTHIATYQARIASADIFGDADERADYLAVPRVTFTDPEVASVGVTESQARAAGLDVRTGVSPTSSSARGWIHGPGAEQGVIKMVADPRGEVLVGSSVMSPSAGEIIGLLTLAVKERIPISSLRELIYPYPTFMRGVEDALRDLAQAFQLR